MPDTGQAVALPTIVFMKKLTLIAGVVALAMAGGGAWWWMQRSAVNAVQYRLGKIERGNLQATVSASGAVNPVTQVSVGTQVSGQIKELFVDFNSEVKAGQLIALIDPETFEYRVRSAQADVDAARAAVLTAQANIAASNAAVSRAQVDVDEAKRDLERQQQLVDKQFVAQSVADKARALVNTSSEQFKAAQAQLGVTQAQVKSAQANVAQRDAALASARIDLTRTKITSPVNGIVIKRAIEKGQTVAASLQAPELFVIAQNLSDMQVDASIDESDVGRIRTGQKATFTVDAFPGQTFDGEVKQVRKAAQNVANVVTYVAVVAFSNTAGRLLPGMTANVRVVTDARESVLKIPNAALRVKIAGVEPAATAASAPLPSKPASATTGEISMFGWIGTAFAQPAGGAGGGMAAQRERLVQELKLTSEQQSKLDAIQAELRPQFMGMRELDDDARPAAREKIMAHMRQKISAMLTPEQRVKYQELQANAGAGQSPNTRTPPVQATTPDLNNPKKVANNDQSTVTLGKKTLSTAASTTASSAPTSSVPQMSGGGPMAEFRNRLVAELALSADQTAKVDAIYADVRPRFATLRDLAPEERTKARDRITADIRARIGDVLTPEQKPKYAALLAETAGRSNTRGRIYLQGADGKPVAYNVRLGISDGTSTELIAPPGSPNAEVFKEGASVIIGTVAAGSTNAAARPATASAGPRMPF